MDKFDDCCSTQVIYGDGTFNVSGLEKFFKTLKLGECGLSYAVVSIIGQQISGKSTLLNHLFGTNFREMDALKERSKTTKGIWMAKCAEVEHRTLVMDLEGTNGRDTAFENQTALFAFALSDIVIINMWCHHVGLVRGTVKPLLKTVFQVMMRLFSPRKMTLLFVIRDKNASPLEKLELIIREDIQKIWDNTPKPEGHKETPLSEFFNIEVTALASYQSKKELFKEQVASLRQRFYQSTASGGLLYDRQAVVPASGFSISAQEIWKSVKENKVLDLPAHKVMVATVRCKEIASEMLSLFNENKEWIELKEAIQSGRIPELAKKVKKFDLVSERGLSECDMDCCFDDGVTTAERHHLAPPAETLIFPVRCKSLWRQFDLETEYKIFQSINAEEANKPNNNWLPPPWAIAALVVLGFNEFMTLLRKPSYLLVILAGYLLVKALWVQLDISGGFCNGALQGIPSLSTKFVPTLMNLLKKLAEEGVMPTAPGLQRNPEQEIDSYSDSCSTASSKVTSSENGVEQSKGVMLIAPGLQRNPAQEIDSYTDSSSTASSKVTSSENGVEQSSVL